MDEFGGQSVVYYGPLEQGTPTTRTCEWRSGPSIPPRAGTASTGNGSRSTATPRISCPSSTTGSTAAPSAAHTFVVNTEGEGDGGPGQVRRVILLAQGWVTQTTPPGATTIPPSDS